MIIWSNQRGQGPRDRVVRLQSWEFAGSWTTADKHGNRALIINQQLGFVGAFEMLSEVLDMIENY